LQLRLRKIREQCCFFEDRGDIDALRGHSEILAGCDLGHCAQYQYHRLLGIIGLTIAVALWEAGYKLSLYHHYATPSSVPVAKLWIESRNASAAATSRFKVKSHLVPGSQAFFVTLHMPPRFNRAVACDVRKRQAGKVQTLEILQFRRCI
jgi:hypothetical protein